jgi:L-idonate 5-dehydrogenase
MRAVVIHAPKDLRIDNYPDPAPGPGEVRVKIANGGICGSDLHYYHHGGFGVVRIQQPMALGHEIAGVVAAVGDDVTGVKPGTRVAVNPSRPCGQCLHCQEGMRNQCLDMRFLGSAMRFPHVQGGFREFITVDATQAVPIADKLSLAEAAVAEPLAVCLHAVARAGDITGKRAVLFGAGPIGLLTMLAAQRAGIAETTVVDIAAAPLAFATKLGANHVVDISGGEEALKAQAAAQPFDVAFEVSGTAAGLASAIGAVRRGGVVVQVGNLPGGQIPVPANAVMAKEIDLRGSFRFGTEFFTAVELIADGSVDVLSLVTAQRPLAVAPDAVRLALDRSQSVKVVLTA